MSSWTNTDTANLQICNLLDCSIDSLYMVVQSVGAEGMLPEMPYSRSQLLQTLVHSFLAWP